MCALVEQKSTRQPPTYVVVLEWFAAHGPNSGEGQNGMAKYLVLCACGRPHTVDAPQAGESLSCDCGATVAVPTLRKLREMPTVGDESAAESAPIWGLRQAATTVSLLAAAACLVVAAASWYSERPVPTIDPVAYATNVDRLVSQMTPLEGWQRWVDTYRPLATKGFDVYKHPATDEMQQVLDWHRWIEWIALALAAVCVAAAIVIGLAGPGDAKS
jgi:hypothetical protein